MSGSTPNPYLRNAVMTASPEQLQLMLYDGAIRFATQGREAVVEKKYEEAYNKLSRAQAIVLEMERGLNRDVAPELCERMAALYMFTYRKLVDGCVQHDPAPIDEAIGILNYERETWMMLLQKLATEAAGQAPTSEQVPTGEGSLSIQG
jgi:flagellar protein FliS